MADAGGGREAVLDVAIDAGHVTPGLSGGLAHVLVGLITALGRLSDGPERYVIVVRSAQQSEWLSDFVGPNQRVVLKLPLRRHADQIHRAVGHAARSILRRVHRASPESAHIPRSDGFYESLGCAVVHFPHQDFVASRLPAVYNPHDLQHRHYPEFFAPGEVARRDAVYRSGARLARVVVVASQWVKDDVVQQYQVDTDKVQVIPWGAPTMAYPPASPADLARVAGAYGLKPPFVLYPARTWPHKNHLRLLDALARLRDVRGVTVNAVFTGTIYEPFWPRIERRLEELRLDRQVKRLGFVPARDMRSIYRLADFLVMPTLFESDSFPIYEAWLDGLPVACSSATALPDQVADAALVFDPDDVESIAAAIHRLTLDGGLREDLRRRGYRRLADFDWALTAKAYRAVYRRAGGLSLAEEDRRLLSWDWMRQPRRDPTSSSESGSYTV